MNQIDSVVVILSEAQNAGLGLGEILSLIISFLTVLTAFFGIYVGNKGLKNFLLKESITERVNLIHQNNKEIAALTNKILNKIDSKEEIRRIASEDDLIHLRYEINRLEFKSVNCSTEVRTLIYFLFKTVNEITVVDE